MTDTTTPTGTVAGSGRSASESGSAPAAPVTTQRWVVPLVVLIAGSFMSVLDTSIVNVSGLLIVAWGTYQMRHIALDTSREHIIWLLAFRAVGLGLCMMPIFTAGISSVPLGLVNQASAFNNVVRQTSAAFGVAAFTALLTLQEAQQLPIAPPCCPPPPPFRS